MKRLILLMLAAWLMSLPAYAYDLLVVQSQRSPVYDEIMEGVRSVRKFSERVVVISDYSDVDLKRIVKEDRPGAVVTLGDLALQAAKVSGPPVISLMAVSYRQDVEDQVGGIEVLVSPDVYMNLFKQLSTERVGVLYSKKTAAYVKRAQRVAAKAGIELIAREVGSSKEVYPQLQSLKGSVDAIWMLPDSEVVTPMTIEIFSNFTISQKTPIITFTDAYIAHGAAIAVEIDRHDLGRQAGDMVDGVLSRRAYPLSSSPRKTIIKLNHPVLKRLGFSPEKVNKILQKPE